jgi:hypothetical protein
VSRITRWAVQEIDGGGRVEKRVTYIGEVHSERSASM